MLDAKHFTCSLYALLRLINQVRLQNAQLVLKVQGIRHIETQHRTQDTHYPNHTHCTENWPTRPWTDTGQNTDISVYRTRRPPTCPSYLPTSSINLKYGTPTKPKIKINKLCLCTKLQDNINKPGMTSPTICIHSTQTLSLEQMLQITKKNAKLYLKKQLDEDSVILISFDLEILEFHSSHFTGRLFSVKYI